MDGQKDTDNCHFQTLKQSQKKKKKKKKTSNFIQLIRLDSLQTNAYPANKCFTYISDLCQTYAFTSMDNESIVLRSNGYIQDYKTK